MAPVKSSAGSVNDSLDETVVISFGDTFVPDPSTGQTTNNGTYLSYPRSGNIIRYDCPLPFFLRNTVFESFRSENYSWKSDETIIVLVGKPENVTNEAIVVASEISRRADVNYSIGGCPLECPFDLNEDFEQALAFDTAPTVFGGIMIPPKFTAHDINDGNVAVLKVLEQTRPFVEELNLVEGTPGSPWQGEKPTPVVCLIDTSNQDKHQVLVGLKGEGRAFSVFDLGKFPPEDEHLRMNQFIKYHQQNVLTFDNRPVGSTVAHAVYEKLHGEYKSDGKVYIEFVYNNPKEVFASPLDDAVHNASPQCKLGIQALPGDANPWMKSLWTEVCDLERWINLLATCSTEPVGGLDSVSHISTSVLDIADGRLTANGLEIQELLAKAPVVDENTSFVAFSDSLDRVLQRITQQQRPDSDFTDRLWGIVRKCEGIEELHDCLMLVCNAVNNKMYRPYVLLDNETTMAKTLTSVMKDGLGSVIHQFRKQATMVKLIIEIGMYKLFKDYNFALAMSHLIARGEIDQFCPNPAEPEQSLNNLKKLHCILEVMCLTKERLALSVDIQGGHVKKMLKKFDPDNGNNTTFAWDTVYHLDVFPDDIRRAISGLHPFYFKVKMETRTMLKLARTTVVASTEKYFEHKRNPLDEKLMRQYYLYMLKESEPLEVKD